MERRERDVVIRKKILSEIFDIEAFVSELDENGFCQSRITQKAVMMSLINIGELSKSFSDDYIRRTYATPWKEIRGLRNIAAHQYEAIRVSNIWLTVMEDVPKLKTDLLENDP